MKLSIVVNPVTDSPDTKQRRFLLICDPSDISLQSLCNKIRLQFNQLYPDDIEESVVLPVPVPVQFTSLYFGRLLLTFWTPSSLQIKKLQTASGDDLLLTYAVSNVFKENDDVIVYRILEGKERGSSIPPTSALRPKIYKRQGGPRKKHDAITEEDTNSVVGTPKSIDSVPAANDIPTANSADAKSDTLTGSGTLPKADAVADGGPKVVKRRKITKEAPKSDEASKGEGAPSNDAAPIKKKMGRPVGSGRKKNVSADAGNAKTPSGANKPIKSVEGPQTGATLNTVVPDSQVAGSAQAPEPKKRQKTPKVSRKLKSPSIITETPLPEEKEKERTNKRPLGLMSPPISQQDPNTDTAKLPVTKPKRSKVSQPNKSPVPSHLPSNEREELISDNPPGLKPSLKSKVSKSEKSTASLPLEQAGIPKTKKRKINTSDDDPNDGNKKAAKRPKSSTKIPTVASPPVLTKPSSSSNSTAKPAAISTSISAKRKASQPPEPEKSASVITDSDQESLDEDDDKAVPKETSSSKTARQEKVKKTVPKQGEARPAAAHKPKKPLTNGVARSASGVNALQESHSSTGEEEGDEESEEEEEEPLPQQRRSKERGKNEVEHWAADNDVQQETEEEHGESGGESSESEEEYVAPKNSTKPNPSILLSPEPTHLAAQSRSLIPKVPAQVKQAISESPSSSEDSPSGEDASSDEDSEDGAANPAAPNKSSSSGFSLSQILGMSRK
ncbi:MAG: hypothetical protein M1814_004542 [Vezdaea aestivalis]|nr:MAG: hypothetical protein M1814_004542 [Vezdaea aestivalis]